VIAPAAATAGVTVTLKLDPVPLKQLLLGITATVPELLPKLTVIDVVPCPDVIVAPAGTVHVYVVAPVTAAIE